MFQILKQIEEINSTNEKKKILSNNLTDDLELFIRMALGTDVLNIAERTIEKSLKIKTQHKYKDIGHKVEDWLLNNPQKQTTLFSFSNTNSEKTFKDFLEFFNKCKQKTGGSLENEVSMFLGDCKPEDAKWYVRCLVKDLKIGMKKIKNKLKKKLLVYVKK